MSQYFKPVILFVDDEQVVRTAVESVLEPLRNRFQIYTTDSGEDGMEMLREFLTEGRPVAVIISDERMPTPMQGHEFLTQASEIFPRARKIMLSAMAELPEVTAALNNARLIAYVAKPFDNQKLLDLVLWAADSFLLHQKAEQYDSVLHELSDLLHFLQQTTSIFARKLDINDIFKELLDKLIHFYDAEKIVLAMVEDGKAFVEAVATKQPYEIVTGLHESCDDTDRYPAELFAKVLARPEMQVLVKPSFESLYFLKREVEFALVIPAIHLEKLVGIFYLENNGTPERMAIDKIEAIQTLVNAAAVAMSGAYRGTATKGEVSTEAVIELGARTADLNEKLEKLHRANKMKDEMMQVLAHDVRSPLSGVLSLAGYLQEPDTSKDPGKVVKYGKIIQNSLRSVVQMTEDLLELARLESAVPLPKNPLDLRELLQSVVNTQMSAAAAKKIELRLQVAADANILGDATRLKQAFNNLVSNAIKFTPASGTVSITLDASERNGRPVAAVMVKDSGIGLAPEQTVNLFEKFSRYQRAGTQGEKGTGLGLSIVKSIVDQHDGEITVESRPGEGTTFVVFLPR
jgi:signal transduction histidine kinase